MLLRGNRASVERGIVRNCGVSKGTKRGRVRRVIPVMMGTLVLGGGLAACGSSGSAAPSAAATGSASLTGTVTAEFDANLTFDTNALGVSWWNKVAKEFHKAYPRANLKLVNIPGNLSAYTTKLALQFRTPATAPDVFQINSQYLGEFASAGYLSSLNSFISKGQVPGWSSYPANVKAEDTFNGTVYGIDEGENIGAILYNKSLLAAAGIRMPWKPTTWNAILSAGEAVKSHDPGVYPIGLAAGTSTAAGGIAQGTGNLILGSSTPTIYDAKTGKWVVNSPGLKETLAFYKSLFGNGLGVSVSDLFQSNAIGQIPTLMSQGKVAIAIGENWYPGDWVIQGSGATWPGAATEAAVAPIPTENGQGPGHVTTLQGWSVAIAKSASKPQLAVGLIKIMQSESNVVSFANTAGFVPPEPSFALSPAFVKFAPLQAKIARYLGSARALPSYEPGYASWVSGMEAATGALASNPQGTSVQAALGLIQSTVSNELGASKVQTLP